MEFYIISILYIELHGLVHFITQYIKLFDLKVHAHMSGYWHNIIVTRLLGTYINSRTSLLKWEWSGSSAYNSYSTYIAWPRLAGQSSTSDFQPVHSLEPASHKSHVLHSQRTAFIEHDLASASVILKVTDTPRSRARLFYCTSVSRPSRVSRKMYSTLTRVSSAQLVSSNTYDCCSFNTLTI